MRRFTPLRAAMLAAALAIACGDDDPPPPAPTPPQQVIETVSGTLPPFSARNHGFQVQNAGTVTVTITELEPIDPDDPSNPTRVGLDIGTLIGSTCQVVVSNNSVTQAQAITAEATTAGTLCARIYDTYYDTGLPFPVDYTLTIAHF